MNAPAELALFVQRLERVASPYMVTGATAAIIYGQPQVTNDLHVVSNDWVFKVSWGQLE